LVFLRGKVPIARADRHRRFRLPSRLRPSAYHMSGRQAPGWNPRNLWVASGIFGARIAVMIRSLAAMAVLTFACAPLLAQAPALPAETTPAATVPAPRPATVRVALLTSIGTIEIDVETERAPITAGNFLKYVDQKRLDGTAFYRAVKVQEGFGLIQAGVRNDPKRVLPNISHEPTSQTGLSHTTGTISMARAAPGSANGDFFITIGDMTSMDADPKQPGDNLGFAAFGRIVSGMDVALRILDAPRSATEGEGVMRGQMLEPQIRIVTARRIDPAVPQGSGVTTPPPAPRS
jgi:peptidyl-prolyl cis-trans isomerase A (cyclophilin A)